MDRLTSLVDSPYPVSTIALAGVAVCVLYIAWTYRDGNAFGTSRRPDLETVKGYFLLGNLLAISKNRCRLLEYFPEIELERKDKSKFLSVTFPGCRIIDISAPHLIEHVQKTNFDNYVKGPIFYDNVKDVLGDGIFATDGHTWFVQRKATSKIFNGNAFRGIISTSLDSNLAKLHAIIKRHADKGEIFDLSGLFFRFMLNSFAEMAFGQDIGALSLDSDAPVPFADAFDYAQSILDMRFMDPFWKVSEKFNGTSRKMRAAGRILDDFAYGIIDQREAEGLGNFSSGQKKEKATLDLLSLYMSIRDDAGKPLTRRALRDAVLNLIIAGRDTTAQALAWTFFHLMANPQYIAPIRAEIDEIGVVDYDSFKTLHQTNAAFDEGLRLHPSVPKNAWRALKDDVIPNGPMVKAGDLLLWSDWAMGRNEAVWGPDAKVFKPSRWLDAEGHVKKESQWKAHFFNGGYRLCLGQDLARYEGAAVLATIIRDFDLTFAPDYLATTPMLARENTPKYHASLTLPMDAPLLVRATLRKRE